jgi:hypothetical protein
MKKLFMIAAVALAFTACTDEKKTETTGVTDTSSNALMNDAKATDSTAMNSDNNMTIANGDIMMKSGKMMIMKDGNWVEMKETTITANGARVMTNGVVMTRDGNKIQLTDGGMVHNNGDIMDYKGKSIGQKVDAALDTAGIRLKEGAKDLKEGTGKLIQKAGEGLRKAGDKMQAKP